MNNYEQATQEVRDAFNALCKGRVEAAVKAEREACAQLVDDNADECSGPMGLVLRANAEAIRARGDNT
jgi:hypothetical protein